MHRIDTPAKAGDLFGAGKHGFKDGNKALGITATELTAAFFNDLQENLARFIEISGYGLVKGDYSQLQNALIKRGFQGNVFNQANAAVSVNAATAAFTPPITALTNGMVVWVYYGGYNTSTTPTLKVDGTAVTGIVKGDDFALAVGDILPGWNLFKYDATLGKWVHQNPATGVNAGITQAQADARYTGIGYMLVRDEKASGTGPGSGVAGVQTRNLNTVVTNNIAGASLSSNRITLPAGTYRINAFATCGSSNNTRAYLYNVTDGINQIIGQGFNSGVPGGPDLIQVPASVRGKFILTSTKVFELRHYCETSSSNGLGSAVSLVGEVEVYSELEVIKES